jgi:hypothetical protein
MRRLLRIRAASSTRLRAGARPAGVPLAGRRSPAREAAAAAPGGTGPRSMAAAHQRRAG